MYIQMIDKDNLSIDILLLLLSMILMFLLEIFLYAIISLQGAK